MYWGICVSPLLKIIFYCTTKKYNGLRWGQVSGRGQRSGAGKTQNY
jgi:hypothetical protein